MKKTLLLSLIILFALFSAACTGNTNGQSSAHSTRAADRTQPVVHTQEHHYERSNIPIGGTIATMTVANNTAYGVVHGVDGIRFFSLDSNTESVYFYPSIDRDYAWDVVSMTADISGDIFYVERVWGDGSNDYTLWQMNAAGDLRELAHVGNYFDNTSGDTIRNISLDAVGNIYVQTFFDIVVFSSSGQYLFEIEFSQRWYHEFFVGTDGIVLIPVSDGENTMLYTINVALQQLEMLQIIPEAEIYTTGILENELFFLTTFGASTYSLTTGEQQERVAWLSANLTYFDFIYFHPLSHEKFVLLIGDMGRPITEITILRRVEGGAADRQVVTLASVAPDFPTINAFNQQSTQYRIELIDYSVFADGTDLTPAITRLNLDLLTGQVPDILDLSHLSHEVYARAGILADLNLFFAEDTNLSRDMFLDRVLALLEVDGELYAITPAFSMLTYVAPASLVGSAPGITLDELMQLEHLQNAGDTLLLEESPLSFLIQYTMFNQSFFINLEHGTAHFDTEEFLLALEYASNLPDSEDVFDVLREDGQHEGISFAWITNPGHLPYMELFAREPLTAIGFPVQEGVGSLMVPTTVYGIGAEANSSSGAWAFIQFLLSAEQQRESVIQRIPILRSVFDEEIYKLMNPVLEEHPELAEGILINGELVAFPAMTEEQVGRLMQLIDTLGGLTTMLGSAATEIVLEGAIAFLAGDRTAEDTVRIIQNRVQTLVSEQHR